MRVFMTGATGFIGTYLVRALIGRGDQCTVVSRSGRNPWADPRVTMVQADPTRPGEWQRAVAGTDAVVNLAGERMVHPLYRWTARRKARLVASRVQTTQQVVAAIRAAGPAPRVLVSGSAIGFYGARGDAILDESAAPGRDFLADLAVRWEGAARDAGEVTRVVLFRTGIVLASDAPALAPLIPLFRMGLGGSWGNGKQWWSWIHIADLVGLALLAIDGSVSGPVNVTASNPVTVDDFADTLGAVFRRPVLFRMPAIGLRLALGEAADMLLHLQRVVPARALAAGYRFRFPVLREALEDLF
ncbi:MAG: TIGR01777 family protein [Gemmatimonadetes bacterium]|nr:TIGR01777 family protein [Gemmatimonadota bacterium]